jgi:hypothetical protein
MFWRDLVATRRFFTRARYGPVPDGDYDADDRNEEGNHVIIRAGRVAVMVMVAVRGVAPPTFRFSGVGIIVHRVPFTFVTCTVVLMRMPMNLDERRRMRPKMRPPGSVASRRLSLVPLSLPDRIALRHAV